ncbi:AAA family ATPase [Tsuneonella sp. HG094]
MQLENLKLRGFRRFEEETNVQLSGKLVALTGPNEAGKSSILKALSSFRDEEAIDAVDTTFNSDVKPWLELSFYLSAADLKAAQLSEASWLIVRKEQNGSLTYRLSPTPKRDTAKRSIVVKGLQKLLTSRSLRLKFEDAGKPIADEKYSQLIDEISHQNPLSDSAVVLLNEAKSALTVEKNAEFPQYARILPREIEALLEFEETHDPIDYAIDELRNRIPNILMFSEKDRNIQLPYNINLYNHPPQPKRPSKPVAEILRQADVSIPQIKQAREAANQGAVTGIINSANEKLADLSRGVWSQSDAALVLALDGAQLDIVVENKEGFETRDRYTDLKSRSDGYRQFIALQVFAFLQRDKGSILLIDEVEQHLHYDAQADLVQLLQNEQTIQKVVYTTHSAGSLPEDLGTGVRLVHWNSTSKKTSGVINRFWHQHDHAGFRPLLFGMGAATLAFFPTRKALIGEGPTELLILPKLLRQSMKLDSLDFQIIHGLANISPKGLPALSGSADGVAYLVDNDGGGRAIQKSLEGAGVDADSIFSLKSVATSVVTVEDLLDDAVWVRAINDYIGQFGAVMGLQPIASAPKTGRIAALPVQLRKQKVSFAYNVLDQLAENPDLQIVAPRYSKKLSELGVLIRNHLGLYPAVN